MNNKYLKTFSLSLQNSLIYKVNFFVGILSGFVPFMVQTFVWINVYNKGGNTEIKGYTLKQLIIYIGFSTIVSKLVQTNSHYEIANDIKSGTINQYVIKPIKYIWYWISKELGSRFVYSIILNIVLIFGAIIVNPNTIGVDMIVFGFLSYFLGFIIYFMLNYCLALLAFWFVEVAQIFSATQLIFLFCSGGVVPISFFPENVQNILDKLPFYLIIYFPINVLLRNITLDMTLFNLFLQCVWIMILIIISKILWMFGIKKYSAFGG